MTTTATINWSGPTIGSVGPRVQNWTDADFDRLVAYLKFRYADAPTPQNPNPAPITTAQALTRAFRAWDDALESAMRQWEKSGAVSAVPEPTPASRTAT